jgi:hypothetical protein
MLWRLVLWMLMLVNILLQLGRNRPFKYSFLAQLLAQHVPPTIHSRAGIQTETISSDGRSSTLSDPYSSTMAIKTLEIRP